MEVCAAEEIAHVMKRKTILVKGVKHMEKGLKAKSGTKCPPEDDPFNGRHHCSVGPLPVPKDPDDYPEGD